MEEPPMTRLLDCLSELELPLSRTECCKAYLLFLVLSCETLHARTHSTTYGHVILMANALCNQASSVSHVL